jgi:lactate permease
MEETSQVPVDILHWLLALSPIVALLVLLAVLKWKAPEAGPVGMFLGIGIALLAFRTPWDTLAVAGGKGVWDALFILFVVWPALLLYRVVQRAGGFVALRAGIMRFTENKLFLVLGFGWVFASFLQGIAGFGTPIAVVAPLLLALGVKPVLAVVIPLIGHAWANMFGTLAVGWLATIQVIDLEDQTQTAFETGILLWIPNAVAGFTIAWLYGRGAALRHAWPFVLIVTLLHGGIQLVLTLWDPVLSNFVAATVALVALYPLARWRYAEEPDDLRDSPIMSDEQRDEDDQPEPVMGFGMALLPYIVLTGVAVAVLVPDPVEEALEAVEIGFTFPEVDTGYEVVNEGEDPYQPFTPFTHPGIFLLAATAVTYGVYRAKGLFDDWKEEADPDPIGPALVGDAVPTSLAIISFLVLSTVMDHSGQTETLALGIAEVAPAGVFVFLSTWIGALGAFMTSSNTASNVLFSPLQQTIAEAEGLPEATIIAAQSNGGAIGNAIAPANVVLGTGTAGIVGKEGQVLRYTLPWTAAVAVLGGIGAVVLSAFA